MQLKLIVLGIIAGSILSLSAQSFDDYIQKADEYWNQGELRSSELPIQEGLQKAIIEKNKSYEALFLTKLLALKIEQENHLEADVYFPRIISLALELKDSMLLANAWNIKARQLMYNQQFNDADSLYKKVWSVYKNFPEDIIVAYHYNDKGFLEEARGNYKQAAQYFIQSIALFEKNKDEIGLANTFANIASTYFHLHEKSKAVYYAEQSLQLRLKIGDKEGIAHVYELLVRIYYTEEQYDSAQFYQSKYIEYATKSGKKKTLAEAYAHLAVIYASKNQYEKGVIQLQEAIRIAETIHHPQLVAWYLLCAEMYAELGNLKQMDACYSFAWQLIEKHSILTSKRDYFWSKYQFYKKSNQEKEALSNYEQYVFYKELVINENVKNQISQLEIQYDLQKKNTQIAIQESNRIRQNLYINLLLLAMLVVLLTGFIVFIRYSYRKKLEQKNILLAERNRISSELHDEVGSSLSAINIMSYFNENQIIIEDSKLKEKLRKINYNTQQVMESISDIVWSLHPDNERMPAIISKMKWFAHELLEASEIDYHFTIEEGVEKEKLNPEKRKDFYLVFKEALNNAAKYSKASRIEITISKNEPFLILKIKDDGVGMNINESHTGNGIKNMKNRALQHQGEFSITSEKENGTVVTLSFPYTS